MVRLTESYNKSIQEESKLTEEESKIRHVGRQDPKRHLEEAVEKLVADNIVEGLGMMVRAVFVLHYLRYLLSDHRSMRSHSKYVHCERSM